MENESSRDQKKVVVCYLASWANYRSGPEHRGKYVVENIDPHLCTHAVYAFAKLENNSIAVFDPWLDLEDNWGLGGYKRFNNLRQQNKELKTLIAIGGWNEGSMKYSEMVAKASTRNFFVQSVVDFLDKYKFNGLDLDWEYPANRGGSPEDKENFILLLQELHNAFKHKNYLLTAAVAAGKSVIDEAYDIPNISRYLDFIHVMTYDFHGAWENVTGFNAPLYSKLNASEEDRIFTVDYAIQYWIGKGAPPEKLVMGLAFYGRSFSLNDTQQTGPKARTTGPGKPGIYTGQSGFLGFNEICLHVTRDGWTEMWEDTSKTPYAYQGDQWVSYDNEQSLQIKAEYIKEKGLAGGFIWSVDTDDFLGTCYGRKYYLQKTITDTLWKQI